MKNESICLKCVHMLVCRHFSDSIIVDGCPWWTLKRGGDNNALSQKDISVKES